MSKDKMTIVDKGVLIVPDENGKWSVKLSGDMIGEDLFYATEAFVTYLEEPIQKMIEKMKSETKE